jgi:hypothetical protein
MTLTVDKDLADALRERACSLNQSIKQVVNDALRRGLSPEVGESPRPPYRVKPFHSGFAPGVDPENPKQFLNDEDDERYLRLTYGEDSTRWPEWLRDRGGIQVNNPES